MERTLPARALDCEGMGLLTPSLGVDDMVVSTSSSDCLHEGGQILSCHQSRLQ